jgi:hypothetical protein
VRAAFSSAYSTWVVDWPELAHFARAALRFLHSEDSFSLLLSIDQEMVYGKLLVSAYPALQPGFAPQEAMPPEDRHAVFAAVGSILSHRGYSDSEDANAIASTLCFLAGFDTPLQPLLESWERSEAPAVQARLCYLLADWWMRPDMHRLQSLTYLDQVPPLRDNQKILDTFLAEGRIARYLWDHMHVLEIMSEDARYTVEWVMTNANPEA